MKKPCILLAVWMVALMVGSQSSWAAVTTVAYYKLGEDDPGATANATGQNPTQDSSANNLDAWRVNSPTNRADTAALSLGSTLSMEFNGVDNSYTNTVLTTAITGVGIEAWAKPDVGMNDANGHVVAFNGSGTDGYGIMLYQGKWSFIEGNIGFNQLSGTYTPGEWIHLGLILDSAGNLSGYTNGVLAITAGGAYAPTANFFIGNVFTGRIDQVRMFTFTGTFNPSDFLIGEAPPTPEPSVVMLLGLGGLLLWRRISKGGGIVLIAPAAHESL